MTKNAANIFGHLLFFVIFIQVHINELYLTVPIHNKRPRPPPVELSHPTS